MWVGGERGGGLAVCLQIARFSTYALRRQSSYEVHQIVSWSNPSPAALTAATQINRAFGDVMQHFGDGGYVNTNSDDSAGSSAVPDMQMRIMARLYGGNTRRLLDIKKLYDPDNLFHHNSNIREGDGAGRHVVMHE